MRILGMLVGVVMVLALSTSCGDSSQDPVDSRASDPSTPTGTASPTATATATPSPGSPGQPGDGLEEGEQSGPFDLVLRDVAVVRRDGRDRVVLSFDGEGTPGWAARFVDEAVLDGAGRKPALEGEAILQVDVSGTPTLAPERRGPVRESLGGGVVDLYAGEAYEGYTQVFLGLDGRTPFEVAALSGPARLVIDLG